MACGCRKRNNQPSSTTVVKIGNATVLKSKQKALELTQKIKQVKAAMLQREHICSFCPHKKKNEQENDYCEKNGMLLTLISMRGDIACPIGQFQPYK